MTGMEQGLRKRNLFVHCLGGASRSPIMVAVWLQRCGYAGIDKLSLKFPRFLTSSLLPHY